MELLNEISPDKPSPGEMLRAFRKREGFTLENLAEITKIKVSNLSALENGKIKMTKHYAEIFAAALRVHPTQFLYPDGTFAKDKDLKAIEKRAAKMQKKLQALS
jgi:transcriptional regulator with XRE-family HTH domain